MLRCACVAGALALAFPALGQPSPLPPEKAFRFIARALNPQTVEARFAIADGYYLYRDKIRFSVEPADAGLSVPSLPEGKVREDQFFGRVETYRGSLIVTLGLANAAVGQKVVIQAESQGCWDQGICYPPQVQRVTVALPAASAAPTRPNEPSKKAWFD
ncbi:MAG TPA: protein-disulfide reductase DsbD domain-containing protein [Casimicrobiaceae bacterium]|nr:protein-disulfide reductase DsbD domain-containing protein [Casimicrobiaceae bacterium]